MKVLFLTPSISRTSGGIFEIERRLAQTLVTELDVDVSVVGLADEHTDADLALWLPLHPQGCRVSGPKTFGYSSQMLSTVSQSDANLAHLHALWMFPSVALSGWRRRSGRPHIITLNGMLEPWALRNSRWKKQIALTLFERSNLESAACIQVNSAAELASARKFGLKNAIAIIPNGIDMPEFIQRPDHSTHASDLGRVASGRKALLYLGRIHPKKGLVNLVKAWAIVQEGAKNEWLLAIAGWDQGGHEQELKKLATELGVVWRDVRENAPSNSFSDSSLLFLGPRFHKAKQDCYRNCAAFILPSFSEGLPMAVLEAWAYGKPVVMTPECNLPEGFATGAALRIEPQVQSIALGIEDLIGQPFPSLADRGTAGRNLIADRFTWPKIASQMKSVYEWVLGKGIRPSSVTES